MHVVPFAVSARALCGLVLALLGIVLAAPATAAARRDVLVVWNQQVPDGKRIADAFRLARDIPDSHQVVVDVPPTDDIAHAQYIGAIEAPVTRWLQQHAAEDEITYIVLVKGVPLRVGPVVRARLPAVSVDSSLTLLYRKLTGTPVGALPVPNPLFSDKAAGPWDGFDRLRHDIYLVTRLDGFTVADALALTSRCTGVPPERGQVVLDSSTPGSTPEHAWFAETADRIRATHPNLTVQLDQTSAVVRDQRDVVGYVSRGAADPAQRLRKVPVQFAPGAIGTSLSSSDVRTFAEPAPEWLPAAWQDRARYFAGSPEWLAGDLIRAGISGWAGAVADPLVDGVARPQILLPAYLGGRSLGEAFYASIKYLGWRNIVLGDPLCRPYGSAPEPATLSREERSGLTRPYFDRVVAQARRVEPGSISPSLELRVAVRARLAQGDRPRALAMLREWHAAHPRDLSTLTLLALTLDPDKEHDEAIAAYRALLAERPGDTIAANNLAYALAKDPARREEALTLARRAYESSRAEPTVADTYGWILHLSGDFTQAERVLADAVARAPELVEARLHLALTYLQQGNLAQARVHWQEGLRRQSSLSDRTEATPLVEAFGRTR
ncbi:MAG TPA: TIGR03790 family protein [Luteitalea sp.]|nr:TIGR03790 family protein [Luteitalea sp.]